MPVANPMINGSAVMPAAPPGAEQTATIAGGASTVPRITANLTGDQNTPLHVATLVLIGVGVLVLLRMGGFRFVTDVGMRRS